LAQRDPGALSTWLNANPDNPQYDRMIEVAAGTLIKEVGLAEVQRLAETVRDPQIRAKVDAGIQKAVARNAPNAGN